MYNAINKIFLSVCFSIFKKKMPKSPNDGIKKNMVCYMTFHLKKITVEIALELNSDIKDSLDMIEGPVEQFQVDGLRFYWRDIAYNVNGQTNRLK